MSGSKLLLSDLILRDTFGDVVANVAKVCH